MKAQDITGFITEWWAVFDKMWKWFFTWRTINRIICNRWLFFVGIRGNNNSVLFVLRWNDCSDCHKCSSIALKYIRVMRHGATESRISDLPISLSLCRELLLSLSVRERVAWHPVFLSRRDNVDEQILEGFSVRQASIVDRRHTTIVQIAFQKVARSCCMSRAGKSRGTTCTFSIWWSTVRRRVSSGTGTRFNARLYFWERRINSDNWR